MIQESIRSVLHELCLTEAKFDKEVTKISRWFVKEYKQAVKTYDSDKKQYQNVYNVRTRKFLDSLGLEHINRLTIEVLASPIHKSVSFLGQQNEEEGSIDIQLYVPLPFTDRIWGNVIANFKTALRHELEHSVQSWKNYIPYVQPTNGKFKSFEEAAKYYMHRAEVEAYVSGLYKRAKATKTPLSDLIDFQLGLIRQRLKSLPTKETIPHLIGTDKEQGKNRKMYLDLIALSWKDYAKKRFPRAK